MVMSSNHPKHTSTISCNPHLLDDYLVHNQSTHRQNCITMDDICASVDERLRLYMIDLLLLDELCVVRKGGGW